MYRATRGFFTARSMSFTPALALLLGTAVVLAGARADAQCTTQASGSIILSPNHGQNCVPGGPPPGPDALVANEAVTSTVSIVNTSTRSTNVFPNCGTAATLTGFTHVDLSCTTADCTSQLKALTFVSCTPVSGVTCVWCGTMPTPANCNAANSCGTGVCGADPNIVLFSYGGGKLLTAASTTQLATIQTIAAPGQQILNLFDNQGNYTCGQLATRGETRSNDLLISGASGGASGSAPLFYPGFCGDGAVQPELGETCDPPGQNGCRADCTSCGDGIIENGGICTTLNTTFQDSCTVNSNCNDKFCSDGSLSLVGQKCQANGDCDSGTCSGGILDAQLCDVRNGNADCRFCTAGTVGAACAVNTDCDTTPGAGDGVCEGSCVHQGDGVCTTSNGT